MNETEEVETLSVTFSYFEDDEIELRTIGYGAQPLVTIEPLEVDDDVQFKVNASLIGEEDLLALFQTLVSVMEEGVETE